MTLRTLVAATVAVLPAFAMSASARGPAPLLPTALVENVKSAGANIEFMDYVGSGQVIKLAPGDVLVLSYLRSCEYETITGGTVVVGMERSDVRDGEIVRGKVPCDGGRIRLTSNQASASAASAFRLQSADVEPTLFGQAPVVQFPKNLARDARTLRIERTDQPSERHEIRVDDMNAEAGFYDLALIKLDLTRGAVYQASIGAHKMTFAIDPEAVPGRAPVVSRLLRFP